VTECEKNCLSPKSQDLAELSQMKCHQTGKLYILAFCDDMAICIRKAAGTLAAEAGLRCWRK
jgi:hypothetical protein